MEDLTLNPDLVTEDTEANLFLKTQDDSYLHVISANKVNLDNLSEITLEDGLAEMKAIQKECQSSLDNTESKEMIWLMQTKDGTIYSDLNNQSTSLALEEETKRVLLTQMILSKKD
jgi:hypothetical protein